MRRKVPNEIPGSLEQRRREIKHILAIGLGGGPIHISHSHLRHGSYVVQLRELLQELGPVFASFGIYLSSRPDLLRLKDCIEFSKIRDRSSASPNGLVRQIAQLELNASCEVIAPTIPFVRFEPEPFESRLLYQLHYGELEKGELVVVKLIHQHLRLDVELQLVSLLAELIAPLLCDPDQFGSLTEDFRSAIGEATDCRRTAEALESVSHDARESELVTVPKVYRELCSHNILITQRMDGIRLDHYIAKCRGREANSYDSSFAVDTFVPAEIARQIVDVWLTQAFDGTMLPVALRAENILIRSARQLAIVDGTFLTLPRASKGSLLDYFCANAADEPSRALTALLKELDGTQGQVSESTLDRQFRQVVAFRDGGWEDGGQANCLSDTFFAQWRLASKHGYRPLRHLAQVYRGTFHLAVLTRQLAPDRDSFQEGVKDLRLTKLLHDISTMLQPSYWGGQADRLAALMVLGPQHLDDALMRFTGQEETQVDRPDSPRNFVSTWNAMLTAILLLISLSFLREQIGLTLGPEWTERLLIVLFIVVGVWVIRRIANTSR